MICDELAQAGHALTLTGKAMVCLATLGEPGQASKVNDYAFDPN